MSKGRLFPLSRDELVEGIATLRSIRKQELDSLEMPQKPLDLLAQQIVAAAATQDWREDDLYSLVRSTYSYRNLDRSDFDAVITMLSDGIATQRGYYGPRVAAGAAIVLDTAVCE